MKTKITILITILTISFSAFAQDFTFDYDDAGNRIERVIYLSTKITLQDNGNTNYATEEDEITEEKTLKEKLGSFDLLVYPNPTRGLVIVKISGEETIESATYKVYDANGKQVANGTTSSSTLFVNLNTQKYVANIFVVNTNSK